MSVLKSDKHIIYGFLVAITLWAYGCEEPTTIEVETGPDLLVFEGLVTDVGDQVAFVRISRARALNSTSAPAVPFAFVDIFDDLGNQDRLRAASEGLYTLNADQSTLTRGAGRSYRLQVTIPNYPSINTTSIYESEPVNMLPTPAIERLSFSQETRFLSRPNDQGSTEQEGVAVFSTFSDPVSEKNFYRWQFEGVFEQETTLPSSDSGPDSINPDPDNPGGGDGGGGSVTCCDQCWRTDFESDYREISLLNDEFQNGQTIEHEAFFLAVDTRFLIKYRFKVRQMSISEEGYAFWRSLKAQSDGQSGIFAPRGRNTMGNMRNVSTPDEVVIGYFGASSVQEAELVFSPANVDVDAVDKTLLQLDCRQLSRSSETMPDGF